MERKAAIKKGLLKYNTGRPCKRGHISERSTKDRHCEECNRQCKKQRYKKDKGPILQQNKLYYAKNKDKICQQKKQYYTNNIEYKKKYDKEYRRNNPSKILLWKNYRCTYIKEATPKWYEKELVNQIYLKRDELNEKWDLNLEVDHIIPLINEEVCGLPCWDNLQLLDQSINGSKQNKYERDW